MSRRAGGGSGMSKSLSLNFTLDLSRAGDFFDIPALGLDTLTVLGKDTADWGIAVIELKTVSGGDAESYDTPRLISNTGETSFKDFVTETSEAVRAEVKTADPDKMHGRLKAVGEGKD